MRNTNFLWLRSHAARPDKVDKLPVSRMTGTLAVSTTSGSLVRTWRANPSPAPLRTSGPGAATQPHLSCCPASAMRCRSGRTWSWSGGKGDFGTRVEWRGQRLIPPQAWVAAPISAALVSLFWVSETGVRYGIETEIGQGSSGHATKRVRPLA